MATEPKKLTIIKLHINKLVVNARGEYVPVTLQRYIPVEKDGKVKAKLRKALASDEEHNFKWFEAGLSARRRLGHGRCGTAYSTSLNYILDYSNPDTERITSPGPEYLPPVVLKVANEDGLERLASEALNYRKLWSLQGVSIPCYYGWFKLSLEDGFRIPGVHSIHEDSSKPRELSILLLERMGKPLSLKETDEEVDDIMDILVDIARSGIRHDDIRYENLFMAPTSPPALPGEICRSHERRHKFRIIDFESAKSSGSAAASSMVAIYFQFLAKIYSPRKLLKSK
ncbi:hypothetical protein BDQ17DRAFT_1435583 [Cyathus striatus]|nr:hypothetical protein BDQ17DRAFT_1435583 [Cyathus striatus]